MGFTSKTFAQLGLFVNGSDASLRVESNAFISILGDFQNEHCDPIQQIRFSGGLVLTGSLINNDSLEFFPSSALTSKYSKISFVSNQMHSITYDPQIGGTVRPNFWQVECNRGSNSRLVLNTDITCLDTLTFSSGFLVINNRKVFLKEATGAPSVLNHPYLKTERQGAQFFPSSNIDTGLVIYQSVYTTSLNLNPANIGVEILGPVDIGSPITIKRGFCAQVNAGKNSVLRYYDVHSPGYPLINNTLKLNYTFNDMNYYAPAYFSPPSLRIFASPVQDMNWSQLPTLLSNTVVLNNGPYNGVMNGLVSDFRSHHVALDSTHFRITIADPNCLNPPLSGLTADTLYICAGQSHTLDAGNNTHIPNTSLRYTWEEQGSNFSHTRTRVVSPGNTFKKYKLLLSDVRGCMTSDSIVIAPQAPFPVINYLNHLNSCIGDSVTFKDTIKIASGTFSTTWSFSDNTFRTGNDQFFRKQFATVGSHAAQINITSNHGCSTIGTLTNIVVYPKPTASFSSAHDCLTGMTHFTNTSASNHTALAMTSQNWDFGLGQGYSSTISMPSYNYTLSGTYSVRLKCSSSFGCKDSVTLPVVIHPRNSPAFIKNNACLNDTVNLISTGACVTGSCSYQWQILNQVTGNGTTLKKLISAPGIYPVSLKVTNPIGCSDSSQSIVVINALPNTQLSISAASLCLNETLFLLNTSTISSGAITGYTWSYGNGNGSNSVNASTSYTIPGNHLVSLKAVSDSGCVGSAQSTLVVHPRPNANYQVNSVCAGKNSIFSSSSTGLNYSYVWDYGNTATSGTVTAQNITYQYPSPGIYTTQLTVLNQWACSRTATNITTIFPNPVAGLGGNLSTCGSSLNLNANNPGSNFVWSPGNQTTAVITATNTGSYQVQITTTNGCINSESVTVKLNAIVVPNLGNDTTVCGSILLNAGYPGSSFLWENGSVQQTHHVNNSGKYFVEVTDQNGCFGTDTVNVVVKAKPIVKLGPDIQTCYLTEGFPLAPQSDAVQFQWKGGSTDSSIVVYNSETIWVTGIAANGCSASDTMNFVVLPTPKPDLGPDRSACGNAVLYPKVTGLTYNWSTGDTTEQCVVYSSGNYSVIVTNLVNGCSGYDSITLSIYPLVKIDLPADTAICANADLKLNAGNTGATFNWSNGSKTQTTIVNSAGYIAVTVTNMGGCSNSDFLQVTVQPAPIVDLGNQIQYLCGNTPLTISSTVTGIHQWLSNTGFNSSSKTVQMTLPGQYTLSVENNGCTASDSVSLIASNNTIVAAFLASTQDTINKPVQFINLTEPKPLSQTWYFGDGLSSFDDHPIHTYVFPQDYSVTLEVTNGYCSDRITKSLHALFKIMRQAEQKQTFNIERYQVYPNPSHTASKLDFEFSLLATAKISLMDLAGKTVYVDECTCKTYSNDLPLESLPAGLYIVRLIATSNQGTFVRYTKLVKTQ